ncbi:outer membrane protein assembly factor BamC [Propionivibrio sp.]|uniref:outer membrane protein assembly factor BamC n=1 Tax=Propionivibrio sp. TaxID=2212460 RepID=UPI00272E9A25|nr:outer membrane protein assembly factor BamC [Propionivibrio sp.]
MRVVDSWPTRCASAVVAIGLLAGCNGVGLESKKIDYKSASAVKVPTLEVPPDLTSPTRDDRFVVPDTGGRGSATFSAYSGERTQAAAQKQSDVLPKVDKVRVERSGNQRWLVVDESPEKLWGTIKDFWQEMGFLINLELPEAGVMETDWAENRAKIGEDFLRNLLGKVIDSLYSTPERDKFRTRLEPGTQPGTTEVYISHRGMYEIYVTEAKDQTRWQPRDADPELEAEMLRRLMVRFGSDDRRSQIEMAEAKSRPVERAKLAKAANGTGALEVQESFDRAWRRVGLALDRVGFTVEDRDRSKGLYFVRYVDPESDGQNKDPGLLSKLAFWKAPPPDPQTRYRVFLKGEGTLTTVQVLSVEGGVDQSDTAKKILGLLFDQLK